MIKGGGCCGLDDATNFTWTTGEIVTAAMLNTHVRDNFSAVFSRRYGHTWAIPGPIAVASGDTDFIVPFFVSFDATTQAVKLASARHRINSGTSATVKLQKNGADVTGFTAISVTPTSTTTDPTDVSLADGDRIALVVTAVSGSPINMTFTVFLQYEAA